jgi:hypothetical protein
MQSNDLFGGALTIRVQLCGHLIKRGRQRAKFVVGIDWHGDVEISLANRSSGARESLDGF